MRFAIKLINSEIIYPSDICHFLFINPASESYRYTYVSNLSHLYIGKRSYTHLAICNKKLNSPNRTDGVERVIPIENILEYIVITPEFERDRKINNIVNDK